MKVPTAVAADAPQDFTAQFQSLVHLQVRAFRAAISIAHWASIK
jgi:hypothetical protein